MATAPRPGAARREAETDLEMPFEFKGETYVLRPFDLSSKIIGQIRRQTGYSLMGLLEAAADGFDIDVVAAMIYATRRQSGENCSYDQIAEGITFADLASFRELEEAEEDPSLPEA